MVYKIYYSETALKSLKKIPIKWQARILKAVAGLASQSLKGKKLQGKFFGLYSYRVWPYRIIYLINKSEISIVIVDIGHRQNVYKK